MTNPPRLNPNATNPLKTIDSFLIEIEYDLN